MTTVHPPVAAARQDEGDARVVALRRPGRWISGAVILMLLLLLGRSVVSNPAFSWPTVGHYMVDPTILAGLGRTLQLTVVIMAVAIVIGVFLAIMAGSNNPLLRAVSTAYVGIFRSVPPLVQLLFWYNLAALYPKLVIGVPFGPELASGSTNALVSPFVAAILGLGLCEGAYMGEIVRAGILSVDRGQIEAAHGLGMRRMTTMRRVILPQAIRVIIPPTGNQTITILKATSLVSVLALSELLYSAQLIYSKTFETIPLLIVVSLWYLITTTVLTFGQSHLERHFGQSEKTPRALSSLRRLGNPWAAFRRDERGSEG